MKYTTYDAALKMKICEEYTTSQISYRQLAEKYDVNLSTIACWIQRYKSMNGIVPLSKNNNFYKIAPKELNQELKAENENQSIPFKINGIDISTNAEGVKAILEAILK